MLKLTAIAFILAAVTVAIHAVGLSLVAVVIGRSHAAPPTRLVPIAWLLIRIVWTLLVVHLMEITLWGLFYYWYGCMPDLESAFYFSGVTYATLGYGDVVLSQPWRLFGPIEGLLGILMCALSGGFFFALVSRIGEHRRRGLSAAGGADA